MQGVYCFIWFYYIKQVLKTDELKVETYQF
jgi:hypothetical protein